MSLTLRQAERIFRVLKVKPRRSSHHISGYVIIDGTRALLVHYSHGRGEVPPSIVHRFRKSLLLSQHEFEELVNGDMTYDMYVELVRPRLPLDEA